MCYPQRILGGAGTPHSIGIKVYGLLCGYDDSEVGHVREVPTQISLEDSYIRLDTISEVKKQLLSLSKNLLKRMHADLLEEDAVPRPSDNVDDNGVGTLPQVKRWVAFPRTLRLTTRPRPPQNPDGSRNRSFARISRSGPMPNFVFSLKDDVNIISERLVIEALLPLFRKLHPEKSGWNLSLVNVAATNMDSEKGGAGRDISKMFKRQEKVLRDPQIAAPPSNGFNSPAFSINNDASCRSDHATRGSEDLPTPSQEGMSVAHDQREPESGDVGMADDVYSCEECGAMMPVFAMGAHTRWHSQV